MFPKAANPVVVILEEPMSMAPKPLEIAPASKVLTVTKAAAAVKRNLKKIARETPVKRKFSSRRKKAAKAYA